MFVLHSYSPDFVWRQSQQEGIDAVFGPLSANCDMRVESLDAAVEALRTLPDFSVRQALASHFADVDQGVATLACDHALSNLHELLEQPA